MKGEVLRLPAEEYAATRMDDILSESSMEQGAKFIFRATRRPSFDQEAAGILTNGTVVINTNVVPQEFEKAFASHETTEYRAKNSSPASQNRLARIAKSLSPTRPPRHVLGVCREYKIAQEAGLLPELHDWNTEKLETFRAQGDLRSWIQDEIDLRDNVLKLVNKEVDLKSHLPPDRSTLRECLAIDTSVKSC